MKIDYKRELESASKSMIMIHDPKLLIKLIVRMIVQKLHIRHAGMILYQPDKDNYVLGVSRGERGIKIPQGYTRFTFESPIVRIFTDKTYRSVINGRSAIVVEDITKMIWREGVIENGSSNGVKKLLHELVDQLQMLNSVVCVPAYYQDKLMAILLLGEKHDHDKYEQDELDFFAALASDAAMAIRNAQLFTGLERQARRNRELFIQTIIVLGSTIEAKDSYTHGHTERVTQYSMDIARQMMQSGFNKFPDNFLENLYIAGLLHDIGKIAVPEAVLNKTGKLTPEEFAVMRSHTIRGVEIVKPLSLPQCSLDGIKYHHERYDGRGYPEGLKGDDIPISAAIIAVADAYDAMTSDRPYRKGMGKDKAFQEIKANTGTQFNPLAVEAFVELMNKNAI